MKKKKVLVDLSILKNIYCGLGQVALNYGNYFKEHYGSDEEYELYLLVPKYMVGAFNNNVKYIVVRKIYKFLPFFLRRFDVWHAIHQSSRFRPWSKKTRYILSIHDFNFMYEKKGKKVNKYLRKIQRKINRADKIVCISHFAKEETEKYARLNGKEIEVIYNGVEQLNVSIEKRPLFVKDDRPFFFTIGEIKKKKNFHVLLPLMKLFPEKELYIAGRKNTDYADFIERTIQEENLRNVHLVGVIANEERVWLYSHCEAFLFPSLFEGFGLPIIEAMSFGKPVFSSPKTSLKEIGGKVAFFWDNFQPEEMKKRIDNHLESFNSSEDCKQKARDYARSFSYDKHMEYYHKIYLEQLNKSN